MQRPLLTLIADDSMKRKVLLSLLGILLGILTGTLVRSIRRWQGLSKRPLSRAKAAEQALAELSERQRLPVVAAAQKGDIHDGDDNGDGDDDDDDAWSTEDDGANDEDDDAKFEQMKDLHLKMVLVVRQDVKKTPAQDIAVLAASAAVCLVQTIESRREALKWQEWYLWWNRVGCGKIVLKCPDAAALRRVSAGAEEKRLPWAAGAKEADEEPMVIAVGPAPAHLLDPITGSFKLLS